MKLLVASVVLLAALVSARPEPPVNQYLPPGYETTNQDRFAPPPAPQSDFSSNSITVESARSSNRPSTQYGAPSSQYSAPSTQYGAPSRQSSAPSTQYGAPSSQYGAPARNSFGSSHSAPSSRSSNRAPSKSRSGSPSSQYSAPARQYSAPSSQYSAPARQYSAPSSQYGAPAQTSAVFLDAQPSAQYGAPAPVYGAPSGGYANAKNAADDDLSEPANYEFNYNVEDEPKFSHRESRQGDTTWGSYEVVLPDGRKQIVEYEADAEGYRPKIRYEEPQGGYAYSGGNNGGPY